MVKVNITDEDLAERTQNKYFAEGVHEVVIVKADRGTTDNGKEYVEFTVKGQDDEEGTARLWFTTEASCKYALSILSGIAVHNKSTDGDKDKVRSIFKAVTDTDQIDNKFLARYADMDAWYSVYKSDRTYTNAQGETKHSYDQNIKGYEPKAKTTQQTADELIAKSEPLDLSEIPFN